MEEFLYVYILKLWGPASELVAQYKMQAPTNLTYLFYSPIQTQTVKSECQ
jgi:hypothetical protein